MVDSSVVLSYSFDEGLGGYIVTGYEGEGNKVFIPGTYNGRPVVGINSLAFKGCTGITNMVIPNSVTSIGSSAFEGCTSLTSITIPFVGASKNGTSNTHFGYIFGASISAYNSEYVPNSLKTVIIIGGESIGERAFQSCTGLTSITIPSSVTTIGDSAFSYCTGLASITVDENNEHYASVDGNLYSKDLTTLMQYAVGKEDASFTISNSVTNIGVSAFEGCTGLTSVVIGDRVTSIGDGAFLSCTGLTSVVIGDNVESIGLSAFENCTGLTSVVIGDSVTSIGDSAFMDCTSLVSVVIPVSVT